MGRMFGPSLFVLLLFFFFLLLLAIERENSRILLPWTCHLDSVPAVPKREMAKYMQPPLQ